MADHSQPDEEAIIAQGGVLLEDLQSYAARLASLGDPRGVLASIFLEKGDAAGQRFVRKQSLLLFGTKASRYLVVSSWRAGFAETLLARHDPTGRAAFSTMLRSPALRFLRRLEVSRRDDSDQDHLKISNALHHLEEMLRELRTAPCRDSIEFVHLRSIDPSGQPASVLGRECAAPRDALRPLKRIREFKVVFDSA